MTERIVGQPLDSELAFHENEYQRLRSKLQAAHGANQLPELSSEKTRTALNELPRISLKPNIG